MEWLLLPLPLLLRLGAQRWVLVQVDRPSATLLRRSVPVSDGLAVDMAKRQKPQLVSVGAGLLIPRGAMMSNECPPAFGMDTASATRSSPVSCSSEASSSSLLLLGSQTESESINSVHGVQIGCFKRWV